MMTPVPQARQTSMPGARLIKGALLNRIAEALQARTPLNAKSATAKGYTGAAKQGGMPAQGGQALPRYDAQRTYVIARSFVQRLAEALPRAFAKVRGGPRAPLRLPSRDVAPVRPWVQGGGRARGCALCTCVWAAALCLLP